jgi:hypothetical protein
MIGLGALHGLLSGCFELPASTDGDMRSTTALTQAQAPTTRVDLRVLVVTDGNAPTEAVIANLSEGLVPHEVVALADPGRPVLDDAYLADTLASGVRRAKFQAVVLPNETGGPPSGDRLTPDELAALARFRREFDIRQLDAYVWPSRANGFQDCLDLCRSGIGVDGLTATATNAAIAGDFSYLKGPVPFDDNDEQRVESAAYFPRPQTFPDGSDEKFTSLLEVTLPTGPGELEGTQQKATLMGVHRRNDGLEDMVLTMAMNENQLAQQTLFPGILRWLTRGVHIGSERSYLSMHIDDVLLPNDRWKGTGDDQIIMTAEDVEFLVDWQKEHELMLDIAYNGGGYEGPKGKRDRGESTTAVEDLQIALGELMTARPERFRWLNHTYDHDYLGCDRNPPPGADPEEERSDDKLCTYEQNDEKFWIGAAKVTEQVSKNIAFARTFGLPITPTELVTGEHGGLRGGKGEPGDNPNLVNNLQFAGDGDALPSYTIKFIGGDTTRDLKQRALVGGVLTVPRYPIEIYYDCGRKADEVDEFNARYPQLANPEVEEQFAFITDREAREMLMKRVLRNEPRPHYVHQSNIAEDRILYPVLEKLLAQYNRIFASAAAVVNPTMSEAGEELQKKELWAGRGNGLTAYVQGGALVLRAPSSVEVPLTVPVESEGATLESWGGQRTGWQRVAGEARIRLSASTPE